MTLILALDIASRTGVAIGRAGEAPHCWSTALGPSKSTLDYRLSSLLVLTSNLLLQYQPDLVVAEDKIGGKKVNAPLIQMFGCVRGCVANRKVRFELAHIASVRSHFLGRNPTKADFPDLDEKFVRPAIKKMVIDRCAALGWGELDEDAADAGAIHSYACTKWVPGHQAAPLGGLFT